MERHVDDPLQESYQAYTETDIPLSIEKAAQLASGLREILDNTDHIELPLAKLREQDPDLAHYFELHSFYKDQLPKVLKVAIDNDDRVINVSNLLDTEENHRPRKDQELIRCLKQRKFMEEQRAFFELRAALPAIKPALGEEYSQETA